MSIEQEILRLKRCDLRACEGACCYDGVYLGDKEEEHLCTIVEAHPAAFPNLPFPFVVTRDWQGVLGRKTAVRAHHYENPGYPVHFTQTRCVFALPDARCSLQVLAEANDVHPWAYKPHACWLHPLRESAVGIAPPPIKSADDPNRVDPHYPGYVSFTPCGSHAVDGDEWDTALSVELAWHRTKKTEG